jgi:autotransporter-associated beta strand protein
VSTGSVNFYGAVTAGGTLTKSGPGTLAFHSGNSIALDRVQMSGGSLIIDSGTQLTTSPNLFSAFGGGSAVSIAGVGSALATRLERNQGLGAANFTVGSGGALLTSGSNSTWGTSTGDVFSLTVDGTGSSWQHGSGISDRLMVRGASTITVQNGGSATVNAQLTLTAGTKLIVDQGTLSLGALHGLNTDTIGTDTTNVEITDAAGAGRSALEITNGRFLSLGAFNGTIKDGAGGAGSLRVSGGTFGLLNPTNTYSGGTFLSGGTLYAAASASLGTGALSFNSGGVVFLSDTVLSQTLIEGSAGLRLGGALGAIATVNQPLNLTKTLTIDSGSLQSGTVRLNNSANSYGGGLDLRSGILELTTNSDQTISTPITGLTSGTLDKRGTGVLTLTAAAPSTSGLQQGVRISEGKVRLTHPDALFGSMVTLGQDNALSFSFAPTTIHLGALSGNFALNLGANNLVFTRELDTPLDTSFSGTGSITLSGNTALTGHSTHTGGTYVGPGNLALNASALNRDILAFGPAASGGTYITFNQDTNGTFEGQIRPDTSQPGLIHLIKNGVGILSLPATHQVNSTTISQGGLEWDFANDLGYGTYAPGTSMKALGSGYFGTSQTQNFSGRFELDTNGFDIRTGIFGGGRRVPVEFIKNGAGTLAFDTFGYLVGTVQVNQGTVDITSAYTIYLKGLKIESGALLTGTGSIGSATTGSTDFSTALTVLKPGAVLAPGRPDAIGQLSMVGLEWQDGATMRYELAADGTADKLVLAGALTKNRVGLSGFFFDFTGSNPLDGGVYNLITFSSTNFVRSDFSYTGLDPYVQGIFQIQGNTLQLTTTVVPEPTTLLLLIFGVIVGFNTKRTRSNL